MVTTGLRRDPVTGGWVVVDEAPWRDDFDHARAAGHATGEGSTGPCPFCEGREADAGAEILAWRDGTPANTPGWDVRVVPNRRPLLRIEAATTSHADGLYRSRDGLGAHEVVIETPHHDRPLQALGADAVWRMLWAWRSRLQDLKRDARFAAVAAFKNHGRAAGARMDHAHSQVVAYPFVPPALENMVRGASAHFEATGTCVFCGILEQELRERNRIVVDTADVVAIAPYASRVPFEVSILPRQHLSRFEDASDATLHSVADTLGDVLNRIDWALERPAYNLALHSAPIHAEADRAFHWHLTIFPRVMPTGGLEWSSGVSRNPVSPERAAAALRVACDSR